MIFASVQFNSNLRADWFMLNLLLLLFQEHRGDLNQAINAYFIEGDRNAYAIHLTLDFII